MAVTIEKDAFVYSSTKIAQMLNLPPSTVVHTITRITQLLQSGEPRLLNDHGSKIRESSIQHFLITHRSNMTPEQLAALTPKQRDLLDYLTTPNEKGQYPIPDDLPQQKGVSKGILQELAKKSRSKGLAYLKNNLNEALNNPDLFSKLQLKVVHSLLQIISEGRSIGGSRGSIQTRGISKELGLYPEYIHVLINT